MDKEKEWALIIEQANIDLKLTLKTALTSFLLKEVTKANALKIIDDTINALKSKQAPKELIERTKNSLKNRFVEWYRLITAYLHKSLQKQDNPLIHRSYTSFTGEKLRPTKGLTIEYDGYEEGSIPNIEEYMTTGRAAGAQSFMDGYVSVVKRTMTSIANKNLVIKDKNGRKMSLRGLAEMTARFEDTKDKLAKLKEAGIKYVLASSHSNASERCQIWQGKLFELDCDVNATYKQEVDLSYVPTPKGKIDGLDYYSLMDAMHHGFLGYNCRHRLVKYTKGMDLFISYDANTIAKERGLEQKQRYLERQIRKYKEKTILSVDSKERKAYQEKSKLYQQKYAEFCKAKGLVRYDWRTRITREEESVIEGAESENELTDRAFTSPAYKTDEYKNAVRAHINDKNLAKEVIRCAKLIFDYEKSRYVESVCIIDKNDLKNTFYNPNGKPNEIELGPEGASFMKKGSKEYVFIHNHRGNSPPSYTDLFLAYRRRVFDGYNIDFLIFTNGGGIYHYKNIDTIPLETYNNYVGNSDNNSMEKGMFRLAKDYNFVFEKWR